MKAFALKEFNKLNSQGHQSLVSVFEQVCNEQGSNTAYSCLGHEMSFSDVERLSGQFAAYLQNTCGLVKGQRIAIQLSNLIQYPITVWGALRAGLIVVNTNPLYTAREQIHQFNDSGAQVLVVLEDLLPLTKQVVGKTDITTVIVTNAQDLIKDTKLSERLPDSTDVSYIAFNQTIDLDGNNGAEPASLENVNLDMQDTAVLQYTGGTTGPSKGAMLSHANLFAGMTMSRLGVMLTEPGEAEIPIVPLPLYHVFGFTASITSTLLHGGTSILIPDPRNISSIIGAMKAYPFTGMAGVNTLLQGIMAHPDFDSVDFSHLKGVIAGGTTLVKEIAQEWFDRTGTHIYEGYGLSETSAVATCNSPKKSELGTVGCVFEYEQIKIIDKSGATLDADQAGEVCIRGPQVMQGYWNRPDATQESIDEQVWFKTGDIGVLQSNGCLKIVDRIKDMILVSGFNVYPNEIEEVIYGHPNITECAAIGVPDLTTGEAVKLFVVSNDPSLDEQKIIKFCRTELTGYKVPKQIVFADDLPKSPAGKILRRELREQTV